MTHLLTFVSFLVLTNFLHVYGMLRPPGNTFTTRLKNDMGDHFRDAKTRWFGPGFIDYKCMRKCVNHSYRNYLNGPHRVHFTEDSPCFYEPDYRLECGRCENHARKNAAKNCVYDPEINSLMTNTTEAFTVWYVNKQCYVGPRNDSMLSGVEVSISERFSDKDLPPVSVTILGSVLFNIGIAGPHHEEVVFSFPSP
jgi:hypothetical protein